MSWPDWRISGSMNPRELTAGEPTRRPLATLNEAITVNVLAGITGSASGGMSIALQTLGETYRNLAQEFGIDEDAFHFHRGEHAHQRAFQRLIDAKLAHGGEPRLQQQPQPQR